jgi:CheY-like chemotaxis protein
VLVVDDNADAREALRILLDDEGFEVRTAADTPDALAQAEIFCPDVVLLDIGVPGDRRLRGRAEAPDVTGRFDPRA